MHTLHESRQRSHMVPVWMRIYVAPRFDIIYFIVHFDATEKFTQLIMPPMVKSIKFSAFLY